MKSSTQKRLLTEDELAAVIAAGNESQQDYIENGFKHVDPLDYWVRQGELEAEVRADAGLKTEYDEGQVSYRSIARTSHAKEPFERARLGLPVAPDK